MKLLFIKGSPRGASSQSTKVAEASLAAYRSKNPDAKIDEIVTITNRFTSADDYLFTVPMWNGGIQARMGHLLGLNAVTAHV